MLSHPTLKYILKFYFFSFLDLAVCIVQVDNYIHNMATCIASLTVGFASCWPVALATLCTTPFILAAGIVSNLFLTRLAEHVQETYSEAALIAEQVLLSNHLPPLH